MTIFILFVSTCRYPKCWDQNFELVWHRAYLSFLTALHKCSLTLRYRLKQLLKKVVKGDTSKEELLINLDYAARVSENIYLVENRFKCI